MCEMDSAVGLTTYIESIEFPDEVSDPCSVFVYNTRIVLYSYCK